MVRHRSLDRPLLAQTTHVEWPHSAVVVIVHGPPGAGKSVLARSLAPKLGLPLFDRDDFKDAMFDALGWSDVEWSHKVGVASWQLLTICVERLIDAQCSVIVDSNFRPADPIVARLRALADARACYPIEVYCFAREEVLFERFRQRQVDGVRHAGHRGYADLETFTDDLLRRRHGPLDLGGPTLLIDTTAAWPDADAVAEWLNSSLGRGSPPRRTDV